MEDLHELLQLLEEKYPTKDKRGVLTYVDDQPLTIGMFKDLLTHLVDNSGDKDDEFSDDEFWKD